MSSLDVDLVATGDMLGRMLLGELDRATIAAMQTAPLSQALEGLGLGLPEGSPDELEDRLAAEYYDRFLGPRAMTPLVLSLREEGRYDGEAAVAVRRLAEALDFEFDATIARGAAIDHLGSLLLLHGELARRGADDLDHFRRRFLAWAPKAIDSLKLETGFYDRLLRVVADFIRLVSAEV